MSYDGATATALPLLSDALDSSQFDPLSFIPAFDFGAPGRARHPGVELRVLPGSLLAGYGPGERLRHQPRRPRRRPGRSYPVVTFHKPRVNDGLNPNFRGTLMTVPDVPHDNYYAPYAMTVNTGAVPS